MIRLFVAAITASCASSSPPASPSESRVEAARAPAPAPIVTVENLAFQTEHELNAAEQKLEAMQPDEAAAHLDTATKSLTDPRIDTYPESKQLRARYQELFGRVPKVRAEVRRREIAANVKAAKETIEVTRKALNTAVAEIKRPRPDEAKLEQAGSAVDALKAALDAAGNLEALDLDYAKYSLAVRKEARAQRETVEKRRLEVTLDRQRTRVEEGRRVLSAAQQKLSGNDVPDEQFAEAEAAAAAIAQMIDEGRTLAAKDREYSTYSNEVTKRIQEARARIETRRLDVAVARQKSELEAARKTLAAGVRALNPRDPADELFAEAKTAAAVVDKLLDAATALTAKHRGFEQYVRDAKKSVDATRTGIEQRHLEVQIARQERRVENARKALADAQAELRGNDVPDEKLANAEAAVTATAKILDEGIGLQDKDRKYATYASEVRKRLSEATARLNARRVEVGVYRNKREIESTRATLAQAVKRLSARDPGDESFAEAKTALTVVEKTLDGAESLTAKDRAFAQYVLDARKAIQVIRHDLDARKLEVDIMRHSARVREAIAEVNRGLGKMGAQPDTNEAEATVASLEKTIEGGEQFVAKDQAYSKLSADAKKRVSEARGRIASRKDDLAMEAQKTRVEVELENLRGAMAAVEAAPGEPVFAAANEAVQKARAALEAGAELERRLAKYSAWATQTLKVVQNSKQKIEARRLELAVRERRGVIEESMQLARINVDNAKRADSTGQEVTNAATALRSAREEIVKGAALETRDQNYAAFANAMRKQIERMNEETEAAKYLVAFREGPVAASSEGIALAESVESAAGAMSNAERSKALAEALARFQACEKGSEKILESAPRIASMDFVVGQRRTKARSLGAVCAEHAREIEAKLVAVKAKLAFYDGPAKSFGRAKELLGSAGAASDKKKIYGEALAHFESCLETGRILGHKHPELSKEEFDVDGAKLTLSGVVADCLREAKSLRTNLPKMN